MTLQTAVYLLLAILVGGTLFAWYNVYLEYFAMCKTCSVPGTSLLWSKCFWGAFFFTAALLTAYYIKTLI
ncbi:MAG TPA: hypothetical protein P5056_02845 [Candidatus Paceibacterota bacterium]|nr:hypothetical protein [Candidatus Paceibacterota bacterium]